MTKKLIIIAIATVAAVLAGCYRVETAKDIDNAWTDHGMSCYTKVVKIEGHKYILMDGSYAGAIVHAASCECMNK